MELFFTKLLDMSFSASWLILAVVVLRLLLRNFPKWIRCVMWALVALRLVLPFSFESALSLVPNTKAMGTSVAQTNLADTPITQQNTVDFMTVISYVWICGAAVMLLYMLVSYIRLQRKVKESIKVRYNILMCDHIGSPFILGIFRPKIYLLSSMSEKENDYVIAHEKAHLKRLDNIWKPLGFLLLCVYWFNPLCWLAFYLFTKDIELACDERVVKDFCLEDKKAYSATLLECSNGGYALSACPLAFSESNLKQRVKSVLSYKKPAFWIIIVGVAACVAVTVFFMTDPVGKNPKNTPEVQSTTVAATVGSTEPVTTVPITTVPATTVPTTTAPPTTSPKEEKNTESTSNENEDYDDSNYYYSEDSDSYDNYYDDSYSDYNDSGNNVVPIQPFEYDYSETERISNEFAKTNEEAGGYNLSLNAPTPKNTMPGVISWDYAANGY